MSSPQSGACGSHVAPLSQVQFSKVFYEIRPGLLRYAVSLAHSRDLAEDLVQDAAISAWRYRDRFIAGTNFKAWLHHILRNKFLSYVRRKQIAKTDFYGDDCPDIVVASGQEAIVHLQDVDRHWGETRAKPAAGHPTRRHRRTQLRERSGDRRRFHRYAQKPGVPRAAPLTGYDRRRCSWSLWGTTGYRLRSSGGTGYRAECMAVSE